MHRRRFMLAYLALGLVAFGVAASTVLLLRQTTGEVTCSRPLPSGSGIAAIRSTTTLWVTDVLMQEHPGCGYRLASRRLRGRVSPEDWASGKGPVPVFATRYPIVPFAQARADSPRTQAVYAISRHYHEISLRGADGVFHAWMVAGLAAPDAGMAAYTLELRLENGSWRVERCRRARI